MDERGERECFTIMPITTPPHYVELTGDPDHFGHVMRHLHKPAIERAGYRFISPSVTNATIIQAQIIRHLETAELVLCDISYLNANVFFELGIRVALDRPVALVRDSLTADIPFDNAMMSCHTYDARLDPWILEDQITGLTEYIGEAGANKQNAMWQYFGITRRAQEADPDDLEQQQFKQIFRELTELREMLRSQYASSGPEPRTGTSAPHFGESVGSLASPSGPALGRRQVPLPPEPPVDPLGNAEPEVVEFLGKDNRYTPKEVIDSLDLVVKQLKLNFGAVSVRLEMTRENINDVRFKAIYAATSTDEVDDAVTLNALALLYERQSGYPMTIERTEL
jgi:hypothetical protein